MFISNMIMRENCDLSDPDCGIVVSVRFSLTVSEWLISIHNSLYTMTTIEQQFCGWKLLVNERV